MKFAPTDQFNADWKVLPAAHQDLFRKRISSFNTGCERYVETHDRRSWATSLRVSPMVGWKDIWEMTWSFTGPDGRATFEFGKHASGEDMVFWRRIGLQHHLYTRP